MFGKSSLRTFGEFVRILTVGSLSLSSPMPSSCSPFSSFIISRKRARQVFLLLGDGYAAGVKIFGDLLKSNPSFVIPYL